MKFNKIIIALLLCLPFLGQAEEVVTKVAFYDGSFPSVKQNAKITNRPFFAYFTANWCMPCRLMDETTWQDPNLANYIDNNYYAAKIDVDDFDGYAYKEQFKITVFPTIILFKPDGTFLKRHEGSIAGSTLLTLLKEYDNFEDKIKPHPNTDPGETVNTTPPVIHRDNLPPTTPPVIVHKPLPKTDPVPIPASKPNIKEQYLPGYQPKPNPIIATGNGLFRFTVERQESQGFSVQVGVYADYENVLREVSSFQLKFKEPILVHIDNLGDKRVYKILIGDFNKREKAAKFKEKVLEKGVLDPFVKDLSLML